MDVCLGNWHSCFVQKSSRLKIMHDTWLYSTQIVLRYFCIGASHSSNLVFKHGLGSTRALSRIRFDKSTKSPSPKSICPLYKAKGHAFGCNSGMLTGINGD